MIKATGKESKYEMYLKDDHEQSITFAEWLRIEPPRYEYSRDGRVRMFRYAGAKPSVTGEFCRTKKEAKASYKQALLNRRLSIQKKQQEGEQ